MNTIQRAPVHAAAAAIIALAVSGGAVLAQKPAATQVDGQWLLHRDIWTTSMPATTK